VNTPKGEGTVKTKDLQNALAAIKPFVGKRDALLIEGLENVKLEHDGRGMITVTGTNLETMVSVPVPTDTERFDPVTVPLVKLSKVIDALAKDGQKTVTLQAEGFFRDVDATWHNATSLTVHAGDSEAELKGIEVDEFPVSMANNSQEVAILAANVLEEAQARIVPLTATDESRPILTAIYVKPSEDGITFAGADGFQLGVLEIAHNGRYAGIDHKPILMPRATLKDLKFRGKGAICRSPDETVTLAYDADINYVTLRFESGATVQAYCLEANFPNYNQVIPTSQSAHLTVPTADYGRAIDFVAPFAKEAAGLTRHEPNGRLVIRADDPEGGTVKRHLDVESVADGEDFDWPTFALENGKAKAMLQTAAWSGYRKQAEEIEISYSTPSGPVTFRAVGDNSFVGVVMPMPIGS
jgi:DNA polymerase-3 subunit beta